MSTAPRSFPLAGDFDTFAEFAAACDSWVEANPLAPLLKCAKCGKMILFYYDLPPAQREGHVYSDAGAQEFYDSQLCEWCFDAAATSTPAKLEIELTPENWATLDEQLRKLLEEEGKV